MNKSILLTAFLLVTFSSNAQKYQLPSPDGKLTANIEISRNINVNLLKEDAGVIRISNISLETGSSPQTNPLMKVQRVIRRSVNEMISPEIREKTSTLKNSFNEMEIRFRTDMSITFSKESYATCPFWQKRRMVHS